MRDHATILKAVADGDESGARVAMHRHLARVEREFQRDEGGGARRRARRGAGRATGEGGVKAITFGAQRQARSGEG